MCASSGLWVSLIQSRRDELHREPIAGPASPAEPAIRALDRAADELHEPADGVSGPQGGGRDSDLFDVRLLVVFFFVVVWLVAGGR